MSIFNRIGLKPKYYFLNLIFLLERTAWFILIIQIPIFIAQKNEGGLGFTQQDKGIIYLYWVLLQNSLPLITGSFIDNSKRKKLILLSSCLLLFFALLSIGIFQNIYGLLFGITLVSIGVSLFNPLMKGQIGQLIQSKNSSLGWGLHFWLYNLAIFIIGVPYAKYLREQGWVYVFVGAGLLYFIAFLLSFFFKPERREYANPSNIKDILKSTKAIFSRNYNYILLISMSGFAVLFMQFYETLPNFIYDWSDTNNLVETLGIGKIFLMQTWAGQGISFEWLYNINTGLTLLLLLPFSIYLKKYDILNSLLTGVLLVVLGFSLSIISQNGSFLILGFIVYTLGELITNPKFTEYFDKLSLEDERSTHMGLLFISNLIGYPIGALLGGYLYGHYGEKASLAQQYLSNHFNLKVDISNAFSVLKDKLAYTDIELTKFLWTHNNPYIAFVPFIFIGIMSLVGILFYKSRITRNK